MPTKLPAGTPSAGGWTASAGTHHDCVSDGSDATYVSCSDGSTLELALDAIDWPNREDSWSLTVRHKRAVDLTQTLSLTVELWQGSSFLVSSASYSPGDSFADSVLTPSEAEMGTVTDPSALRVRLIDAASPLTSEHQVSLVSCAVPETVLRAHVGGS